MTTKLGAMLNNVENCKATVEHLLDDPGGPIGEELALLSIELAALQLRIIASQPDEPISGDTVELGGRKA